MVKTKPKKAVKGYQVILEACMERGLLPEAREAARKMGRELTQDEILTITDRLIENPDGYAFYAAELLQDQAIRKDRLEKIFQKMFLKGKRVYLDSAQEVASALGRILSESELKRILEDSNENSHYFFQTLELLPPSEYRTNKVRLWLEESIKEGNIWWAEKLAEMIHRKLNDDDLEVALNNTNLKEKPESVIGIAVKLEDQEKKEWWLKEGLCAALDKTLTDVVTISDRERRWKNEMSPIIRLYPEFLLFNILSPCIEDYLRDYEAEHNPEKARMLIGLLPEGKVRDDYLTQLIRIKVSKNHLACLDNLAKLYSE